VQAGLDRDLHQLVPRGVEVDLVEPVAEPVVRLQDRRVLVGLEAPREQLGAADARSEGSRVGLGEPAALAMKRLAEGRVAIEGVVADERRDLIQHLVRRGHGNPLLRTSSAVEMPPDPGAPARAVSAFA
jgi:hypothetical protein